MIRIRFFGPGEFIQKLVSGGTVLPVSTATLITRSRAIEEVMLVATTTATTVQKEDTNRKETVKRPIQQFANHPNGDSLTQDLN